MKVMIVDDEPIGRDSLQALLTSCDFDVCAAANGPQAIDVAKQTELDVALIDWMLSDETDGFGVADALREMQPAIRIVILSGQLSVQVRASQSPQYDFLTKPFQLAELLALIQGNNGSNSDAATRD